jgi:hypothetical protein
MKQFKELTIQSTANGMLPQLPLHGKWLEEIGFTVGHGVRAIFENSCLTLTVDHSSGNLLVESRMVRKKPRTLLVIDWWLLRKYGFYIGDCVGLTLMPNMIQITKIVKYSTTHYS